MARRLAGFEVLAELGRGGMATVFLAQRNGVRLALKVLHTGSGPVEYERFGVEVQAIRRLDHPGIVRLLETGFTEDGSPYLAMELVDGVTLQQRLQEGPLPTEEAVRVAGALAEAIAHAHARGVLHRDLKPGNVLIDRAGHVRLADFGLAKLLDGQPITVSGELLGTPNYMSPEQARGDDADERTDVYGLGALLYVMLTGRPPFQGSLHELLLAITSAPLIRPSRLVAGVHPTLEAICLRCLERDPASRYASAWAVSEALRDFAEAAPELPASAPKVWPWLAAAVAVPLVLIGSIMGISLWLEGLEAPPPAQPASTPPTKASGAPQPYDAPRELRRANALLARGQMAHALAKFLTLTRRAPKNPDGWRGLSVAQANLGRHSEASDSIQRALALSPQDAVNWSTRSNLASLAGRLNEAERHADRALQLDPEHVEGYVNRGAARFQLGKVEAGLSDFNAALLRNPKLVNARKNRAMVLIRKRNFKLAEHDFDYLILRDPRDGEAHRMRGELRLRSGDTKHARVDLERAAKLGDGAAWVPLGYCLALLGEPAAAHQAYSRALERRPGDPALWAARAKLLQATAASDAKQALRLDPKQAGAHQVLASLAVKADRLEVAARHLRAAAELEPRSPGRQSDLALVLTQQGALEEAAGAWRRASELAPREADYLLHWSKTLSRLRRAAEALAISARALKLVPKHAFGWALHARQLEALNRRREASQAWRRALKFGATQPEAAAWRRRLEQLEKN